MSEDQSQFLAAVDLGSNSFHMVVARYDSGQLVIIDRLREMVRLAGGLQPDNTLDAESQERALGCLARFGQRLREIDATSIRVVGTNTLRKARDSGDFLKQAGELLGQQVEIISGVEEARLVYTGVMHGLPEVKGDQMVFDIGGGSTEVAAGRDYQARRCESLYMGCVSVSQRFFPDGRLTQAAFNEARLHARLELRPVKRGFAGTSYTRVAGASGTIRAASSIATQLGFAEGRLTREALSEMAKVMLAFERIDDLDVPGLSEQRSPVFIGGLAILTELFDAFDVGEMRVADSALREGVLYDLAGMMQEEDPRLRTVRSMQQRYNVDLEQADRVAATADRLWQAVANDWELDADESRRLLRWACQLHELGLDIAHAGYHRHGAYVLEHADMPGFTRDGQRWIAALVASHRRRIDPQIQHAIPDRRIDDSHFFSQLPRKQRRILKRLIVLMRLAVLIHRGRSDKSLPDLEIAASDEGLMLNFPAGWLEANPLTAEDLNQEREFEADAEIELTIGEQR